MGEETITIPKAQYDQLIQDQQWLQCLAAAGVDNWEGYDHAVELLNANIESEEE